MANSRLTAGCYRADSRLLPPASCSPPRSLPVASARSRALLRDQGCGANPRGPRRGPNCSLASNDRISETTCLGRRAIVLVWRVVKGLP